MTDTPKDATNLGAAKGNTLNAGGYAWFAPVGSELPTNAIDDIPSDFESLGYISEDGLTTTTDTDTETRTDWGGETIKSDLTSFTETFQASFLESRESVLKAVYGDANVTSDGNGSIAVSHNARFTTEHAYIFESLITDTLIKRTVIPRGSISERDDVSENPSDLLAYTPTITALADESGNTSYVYYYDSAKAAHEDDDQEDD